MRSKTPPTAMITNSPKLMRPFRANPLSCKVSVAAQRNFFDSVNAAATLHVVTQFPGVVSATLP
jgi:hypothetical protein